MFLLFKFSLCLAICCCQLMLQCHVHFRLPALPWFLISAPSFGVGKRVPGGMKVQGMFMDVHNWYVSQITQETSTRKGCACSHRGAVEAIKCCILLLVTLWKHGLEKTHPGWHSGASIHDMICFQLHVWLLIREPNMATINTCPFKQSYGSLPPRDFL